MEETLTPSELAYVTRLLRAVLIAILSLLLIWDSTYFVVSTWVTTLIFFLIGLFPSLTFLVKTSLSLLLAMYFFPKETLATLTGFIN
jgi:hypothetical protein